MPGSAVSDPPELIHFFIRTANRQRASFEVLLASCLERILEKDQGISALRLQDCGQPSRARARGRDFRANSVTQLYSVKTVAVMSDVIDCLEVHDGMPSDLDERIAI